MKKKPSGRAWRIVCIQAKSVWWNGRTGRRVFFRKRHWEFSWKFWIQTREKYGCHQLLEKIQDKIVISIPTLFSPAESNVLTCRNTANRISALHSVMKPLKRPWT